MNLFEKSIKRYLSTAQLKKIQSVKIGLGGAGGLGSNIAFILTRTGFKHFEILDSDVIEPSNLNRQQYFLSDVGQKKAHKLREYLLKINPDMNCSVFTERWRPGTGNKYFGDCDFIIEAFDQADCKAQFVEYYQDKAKFVISGNGMAEFSIKESLKIKKLNNVYIIGDRTTNIEDRIPPLAPRVTACASIMAGVVLDLTLQN